jgi:hypothetical protein
MILKNVYKILVGMPEGERNHSEDVGVDETIILKWMLLWEHVD